ncbi:MAG: hypothetical protein H7A46_21170 [Verrucomicrobiales bacterium]|nr:hypothetical protein [Verrucomicrobiales bacterium]
MKRRQFLKLATGGSTVAPWVGPFAGADAVDGNFALHPLFHAVSDADIRSLFEPTA